MLVFFEKHSKADAHSFTCHGSELSQNPVYILSRSPDLKSNQAVPQQLEKSLPLVILGISFSVTTALLIQNKLEFVQVLLSKPATNMGQQNSMFHNFPKQMVKKLLAFQNNCQYQQQQRKDWIHPNFVHGQSQIYYFHRIKKLKITSKRIGNQEDLMDVYHAFAKIIECLSTCDQLHQNHSNAIQINLGAFLPERMFIR